MDGIVFLQPSMPSWTYLLCTVEVPKLGLMRVGFFFYNDLRDAQKTTSYFPFTQNYVSSKLYFYVLQTFHHESLLKFEHLGWRAAVIQSLARISCWPSGGQGNDQVGEGLVTAGPSGKSSQEAALSQDFARLTLVLQ